MQDIARVSTTQGLRVNSGPENRSIFLGMNTGDEELEVLRREGQEPFAELEVRQAMNMAIDREAIKEVMADQSIPSNTIVPPFVNGYTEELDAIPHATTSTAPRR